MPDAGQKVTINVFAHQASDVDLGTNKFTKKMEEQFNIKFNWTTVPFDGAAEKGKSRLRPAIIRICTCSFHG